MLFNSLAFAVFLPCVFFLYWALPEKYRGALLLIASYYFYMSWNVKYVVLILFTTIVSYVCALCMEKYPARKKPFLWGALVSCLGILFLFKYFNFFMDTLARAAQVVALPVHKVTLALMLPVGISFYTFQTLSYVIDVYRGDVRAERNFFTYAAFISFFPQLVAGPIERTGNLLPQIKEKHVFDSQKAVYGLKLMAWGFLKKLVIADNLAVYVDQIFGDVHYYSGFSMLLAALFFTIQIYCDFSGYSDIAIGTAKLFGINLMRNFNSPYFATSVRDFWSRWHISLSTWFRDYVYIPLGGNRKGRVRTILNQLVTMLVSGLWHGAAFTYVVWGGIHGILQALENVLPFCRRHNRLSREGKERCGERVLSRVLTFMVVMLAWVFFRADSLRDACYVLVHMWDGISRPVLYLAQGFADLELQTVDACLTVLLPLTLLWLYDYKALTCDPIDAISRLRPAVRWGIYYAFIFLVLMLASFNAQEFVYFQF